MGNRKKRDPGPQRHAEGMHGRKTHGRFIEMLQERQTDREDAANPDHGGTRRLHESREQHDEAEKNSEKVEAIREVQRGRVDENVLANAGIPREGDGR